MYAIYHGREGLREIANRVHRSTLVLAETLRRQGHIVHQGPFFDTIKVSVCHCECECVCTFKKVQKCRDFSRKLIRRGKLGFPKIEGGGQ